MIPCGTATPSRLLPHLFGVTRGRLFLKNEKTKHLRISKLFRNPRGNLNRL